MNIMDKPTLQEVKEYFKNAKEVKDSFGISKEIDLKQTKLVEYTNLSPKIFDKNGHGLWCADNGFSEIISYKEPLYQLTAKEVVHAYENPQWLKDTFKECFETAQKEIDSLIKEAIERGFVKGVNYVNTDKLKYTAEYDAKLFYNYEDEQGITLDCGKGQGFIYSNGIWAEIIQVPTYTIPEAESKFNIKIKAV